MGVLGSVATVVALTAATGLPAAAPVDTQASCNWRLTAKVLYQEVRLEATERAVKLRNILEDAGVAAGDFLPASCTDGSAAGGGRGPGGRGPGSSGSSVGSGGGPTGNGSGSSGSGETGADGSVGAGGGGSPRPGSGGTGAAGAAGSGTNGNCPTTAADTLGWGTPNREDDFEAGLDGWGIYDGAGHAGNGTRSPDAITTADGILTITGTPDGQSGGMAWNPGQMYGRWEGCAQSPPGDPDLHSLLLLWPDAENWPVGGETDFMEISDPARQTVEGFFHYGEDNSQESASVDVDATQWHAFAVEWTPEGATYFVDGEEWWNTTDTSILPPGPQHLTIQLDNFGDPQQETQMHVDWVRQYSLDGTGSTAGAGSTGTSGTGQAGSSDQNHQSDSDDDGDVSDGGNSDEDQSGERTDSGD